MPGCEISRASAGRLLPEVETSACLPACLEEAALSLQLWLLCLWFLKLLATQPGPALLEGWRQCGSSAPPCLPGPGFTPAQLNISNEVPGEGGGACLRDKAGPFLYPPPSYHHRQAGLHRGLLDRRLWWQHRLRLSFCFTLCKFPAWASLFIHLTIFIQWIICVRCWTSLQGQTPIISDVSSVFIICTLSYNHLHLPNSCWMRAIGAILRCFFLHHSFLVTSNTWSHQLLDVFSRCSNSFIFLSVNMLKSLIPKQTKNPKLLFQIDVPFTTIIFFSQQVIMRIPAMCQTNMILSIGDKWRMRNNPWPLETHSLVEEMVGWIGNYTSIYVMGTLLGGHSEGYCSTWEGSQLSLGVAEWTGVRYRGGRVKSIRGNVHSV